MTATEFWLIVFGCIAGGVGYCLGRIDGYWQRADEDRKKGAYRG